MESISEKRCFHHGRREAVARCPECLRFFCRECVTEHDDRLVCASCLKKLVSQKERRKSALAGAGVAFRAAAGLLFLWLLFYGLGRSLIMIPSSFHEGTLWKNETNEH